MFDSRTVYMIVWYKYCKVYFHIFHFRVCDLAYLEKKNFAIKKQDERVREVKQNPMEKNE